jgi:hypothetical protein
MSVVTNATFAAPRVSLPAPPVWSLYGNGHVIAAAIVRDDLNIEAQILLDGMLLYRSRHATVSSAAEELGALRGQWSRDGWIEPS